MLSFFPDHENVGIVTEPNFNVVLLTAVLMLLIALVIVLVMLDHTDVASDFSEFIFELTVVIALLKFVEMVLLISFTVELILLDKVFHVLETFVLMVFVTVLTFDCIVFHDELIELLIELIALLIFD